MQLSLELRSNRFKGAPILPYKPGTFLLVAHKPLIYTYSIQQHLNENGKIRYVPLILGM